MNEENNKLLENIMSMLGDNPSETISELLSDLSSKKDAEEERKTEETTSAGAFSPDMLMAMQGLLSQLNSNEQDERSQLLFAIRPFLSEERRPQIDKAVKLMQLTKLAKTAQELNLFNGLL